MNIDFSQPMKPLLAGATTTGTAAATGRGSASTGIGFELAGPLDNDDKPLGGRSLIERVLAESRVPVLAHLEGNCHAYVHGSADPAMAVDLAVNGNPEVDGRAVRLEASVAAGLDDHVDGAGGVRDGDLAAGDRRLEAAAGERRL